MNRAVNLHVSIDCVVLGFDGNRLCVLLVRQVGKQSEDGYCNMKLPGSLIYEDEDLDEAAKRVLNELTGLKHVQLSQFKAYGSKNRMQNPRDVVWLERFQRLGENQVSRIVTIAYLSLVKINKRLRQLSTTYNAEWVPIKEIGTLAFDHNQILNDALTHVRNYVDKVPSVVFEMLPRKFTALQLRTVYSLIYGKELDVRNFHKKMMQMPYVIPLEEREVGVNHRAARYYRFDIVIYKKSLISL